MIEPADHRSRVAAALRGALAADRDHAAGPAMQMLGVAESIAERGALDLDDLRSRQLTGTPTGGAGSLLVRVLPFGLATPDDRPRLRRDAYRCAAAAGADEGAAIACVATALVAADLLRWDPSMTAIRVRQSLLEDAPMATLNCLSILAADAPRPGPADGPDALLQLALSALTWTAQVEVSTVLAALGEDGRGDTGILAAALAGAVSGRCDVPVEGDRGHRADAAAATLGTPVGAGTAG